MSQQPNIIILILDTLRAKNMSSYGYPVRTTPHIDEFAAENLLFSRAISPATWTVPSHASLLSGLYISQHRIESIKGDRSFNGKIVTIPKALKTQGYRSAAFSQNMLFSSDNHLEEGFDEFHNVEDFLRSRASTRIVQRLANDSIRPVHLAARYIRKMIAPRIVLDNIFRWIQTNDEETPFFLLANVLAPHFPWTLPLRYIPRGDGLSPKHFLKSEFLTLKKQWEFNSGIQPVTQEHRRIWRTFYDAAITHVDDEVGRFIRRLRKWKGWDNTILVITSDHGEMMGEHHDIVGHMLCLHDNLIHVPLVIHHPDYPKSVKIEGVVQTLDLYPSVLHWGGVPKDLVPVTQLQRPILSSRLSDPSDTSGYAFSEEDYSDSYDVLGKLSSVNPKMDPDKYPRQQIAVRTANYKYIWYSEGPGEFYDLTSDKDEEQNLIGSSSASNRSEIGKLKEALASWRSSLELFPPRTLKTSQEIDVAMMNRLRDLGYVP